jgi:hypothetical protein
MRLTRHGGRNRQPPKRRGQKQIPGSAGRWRRPQLTGVRSTGLRPRSAPLRSSSDRRAPPCALPRHPTPIRSPDENTIQLKGCAIPPAIRFR